MPLTYLSQLRVLALLISVVVAAWLSFLFLGGLMVFGFGTPMSFALAFMPVMALPAASLAWWKPRVGLSAWVLIMVMFFGAQAIINWPRPWGIIYISNQLGSFTLVAVLLSFTAVSDGGQRPRLMPNKKERA
jgi:hypothetical protein